jgi:cellulose synthase/poly-beta-1,6-N-acetylglucosamine synthase-like glycosyltransferase
VKAASRKQVFEISGASDDGTDQMVADFSEVQLLRSKSHQGKSAGLSQFIPFIQADLLLFTDANTMFEHDAVVTLSRHFEDPEVGYVVGAQRYRDTPNIPSFSSEAIYWHRELRIKELESQVS